MQLPDGPQACVEAVERLILRDWWKADMRLTNLLFSVLRKSLAAQKMPRDAGALVQVCCDVIRGTFGRGTRFFLQVLADLMLHCGASNREELVMTTSLDLVHTAWTHKLNQTVGEHDSHIVAAVVGVVERMMAHVSAHPEASAVLLQRFVVAGGAGLSLVVQVLSQSSAPAFSAASMCSLLSSLMDQSAAQCDALLDDVALFKQVYIGMASCVTRLPQSAVESWLWQNMLTPHVVSAQLLTDVWAFVLRQSVDLVQIRHLTLLIDCYEELAGRRLCQRRVSAIIGCLFLSCTAAVQIQVCSAKPGILCHVPPSPKVCQEAVNIATSQIAPAAAQLTSDPSIVNRLSAYCRIGAHQLTHQTAAPLAQSVREVYLRLGASSAGLSVREQRAAVLLVSSLAMWVRPDELRKFFARMLQTRTLSPLTNVTLLGRLAGSMDSSCVDAAAALLSAAFSHKDWAVQVGALHAFRLLSTECASLDGGMIGQLAGPQGSKQNESIVAFLSSTSRSVKTDFANALAAQALALATTVTQKTSTMMTTTAVPMSPSEFASLSMTLVNTVRSLQNCNSDLVASERFQTELNHCISILQELRRK